MVKKLIIFSYSFVAGIAVAMILHPAPVNDYVIACLWFLSCLSCLFYILFKKRNFAFIFLMLMPAFFSSGNYYRAIEVSGSNHITSFFDRSFSDKTFVTGTVIREPDARDFNTRLTIKPELIEKTAGYGWVTIKSSHTLQGKTGLVLVTIYPELGDYYNTVEYGDRVKVYAALLPPSELRNPAGFDYQKYLKARNIYAVMYARHPGTVQYLGSGDTNLLTRISIKLKRRFLLTIRKTMPYPESAFLGGVTLGSRGGVPLRVKKEFQATGVAHVLAVSGLHVGFVHVLILMLCNVFRIPKKPRWFILVFGLLLFTIITGASPATRRAALMSSIGQFAYTFGGLGMRLSTVVTIPVAAFIILLFDPLMLPDGSFVLSFVAVWSLAYLTKPVGDLFKFVMKGWAFVVMLFWILLATGIAVISPERFIDTRFSGGFVFLMVFTVIIAKLADKKFPLSGFEFQKLPDYFVSFTYSQIAIQIGMMLPLSAVYFKLFPVAGVFANYIAIPLIGYVVQLGLLADLFELAFSSIGLSSVGLRLAFLINSANFIFSRFFLNVARFFAEHFPYPMIKTPTPSELVGYYIFVLGMVYYKQIFYIIETVWLWLKDIFSSKTLMPRFVFVLFSAAAVASSSVLLYGPSGNNLRVTFLDAGFGSSILIATPSKKHILIDGGGVNFVDWTLLPVLSKYKIRKIDKLVLTSPEHGNIKGLIDVLPRVEIGGIHSVLDPKKFSPGMTYKEFLGALDAYDLKVNAYSRRASEMYCDYYDFLLSIKKNPNKNLAANHIVARAGDTIYEEGDLKLFVVWPPEDTFKSSGDIMSDNSVVLKLVYGKVSFLLTSNINRAAEWELVNRSSETLKSTFMTLPAYGHKSASSDEFLSAVSPSIAILQFGYSKGRSHYESDIRETLRRVSNYVSGDNFIRLDKAGAVSVVTDGKKYEMHSVLGRVPRVVSEKKKEAEESESVVISLE